MCIRIVIVSVAQHPLKETMRTPTPFICIFSLFNKMSMADKKHQLLH